MNMNMTCEEIRERCPEAGMDGYISKPVMNGEAGRGAEGYGRAANLTIISSPTSINRSEAMPWA